MLRKGLTAKQKNVKILVHPAFNGLSRNLPCLKELFKEMVLNSPSQMFTAMQGEILVEGTQPLLIDFLNENHDTFIKYADLRSFMSTFLHLLCSNNTEMKHKKVLDGIFHQMVEISGEEALEKEISRVKVSNPEPYNQYLSNYGLSLSKNCNSQPAASRNYRVKENRLKYWEEEGWHEDVTSNHILKLCNIMAPLG